jgi:DNA primase large subunit
MLQPLSPQEAAEYLQSLKPLSAQVLERVRREAALEAFAREQERAREVKRPKDLRWEARRLPRWVVALIEHLRQTGVLCHAARVAVVRWMYFVGYSREEIIEVFKTAAADFKEKKTAYHTNYEIRRMGEECRVWQPDKCKEKPWRCETVVRMCGGEKVPPNLPELCPGRDSHRPYTTS